MEKFSSKTSPSLIQGIENTLNTLMQAVLRERERERERGELSLRGSSVQQQTFHRTNDAKNCTRKFENRTKCLQTVKDSQGLLNLLA